MVDSRKLVMSQLVRTCVVAFVVTLLVTGAVGHQLCSDRVNDFKWRRYPDRCDTAYFCFLGRAVDVRCSEGHVIDTNMRFCVPQNSEMDDCTPFQIFKHVRRFNTSVTCKPGEKFPSETSCAKYVECASSGKSKSSMVERECPCPQLYDITTQKCSHYSNVQCEAGVFEPKSPCDYEANKCQSSIHCIPCNVRFPSCAGLPDGMNAWQGKKWSPHYVVCHQERISQQGMCKAEKESQIFHPNKRTCVQFDEVKDIIG